MALLALVATFVVGAPSPASASTGGSGSATGVDVDVFELTVGPVVVIPGVTATAAQASAPTPDAAGNGVDTDTVVVDVGPVELTTLTAQVERTTSGLQSTSSISDFALTVGGVDVAAADLVSSVSTCPIPGAGSASSSASIANLTVGGSSASIGDVVEIGLGDFGFPGVINAASLFVTVSQQQAFTATTASATGLVIDVEIVVDAVGLPAFILHLVDLSLAATDCTQPDGIAPTAASISPAEARSAPP